MPYRASARSSDASTPDVPPPEHARSRSSWTSTSPLALIVARKTPRSGVIAYRSPSLPSLGSSVISTPKQRPATQLGSEPAGRSARAAPSGLRTKTARRDRLVVPVELHGHVEYARRRPTPGEGCTAGGHECTNSTPRALTVTSVCLLRSAFPSALDSSCCITVSRGAAGPFCTIRLTMHQHRLTGDSPWPPLG